jgi:uncharacterized phage-associated protein
MDKKTFKVSTFLNREDLDFLYNLEQDLYFTHGLRIPRAKLIQEIIEAFQQGPLRKDELQQALIQKFKETKDKGSF